VGVGRREEGGRRREETISFAAMQILKILVKRRTGKIVDVRLFNEESNNAEVQSLYHCDPEWRKGVGKGSFSPSKTSLLRTA